MGEKIDGKAISKKLLEAFKNDVADLAKNGINPKLTVILVGNHPESAIYVKYKEKAAHKVGVKSIIETYPEDVTQETILKRISELNSDKTNHGILVQLPLPKSFNEEKILLAIDPKKDVDGFHPVNTGKLVAGSECLKPCTPSGVLELIESTGIDIAGKDAVVVGRSNIVGKPIALMLLQKHATVTICHSRTKDLQEKIRNADIVVAAIGRPEFIKGAWIKPGAVVIDVGINRLEDGSIKGDVQFDIAKERAAFITPVPGGVGPMTIAMLMKNTIEAAKTENR
jgi:methylenetetrahydrofolate dehydrogenase (NADP+)/methenyltetrahydrofolate cyclohydrolase